MAPAKQNYYEILGLNQSATSDEIRRAYRILARRYHPDLNPGKSSEEKFKTIALAYQTLSDSEKKRVYDSELDSTKRIRAGFAAYERAQRSAPKSPKRPYAKSNNGNFNPRPNLKRTRAPYAQQSPLSDKITHGLESASGWLRGISKIGSIFSKQKIGNENPKHSQELSANKVSVIEVSITMQDALFGGRKTIEVPSEPVTKKISLRIPAGVRTGSVLRMRSGTLSIEDFVIIMRVAPHPLIELLPKGVIVDLPVTISEALFGAALKVPGLEQEESIVIPPGSQSGQEIRITSKGVKFDDGRRGDIFYRLNIQIPSSHQAVGIKEKTDAISEYYETAVRHGIPQSLRA